ncbi:protein YhfH [Fictibacillus enclensis]|nr:MULTISPECIES: protein YhfH [Fictibacillus]MDM5199193.1 protein YhfH [Fictibacillus enclensis]MDM5338375.1 protein YhfH [Fictibacillus enclensis]RXY98988.1 YhfH family protein [Fictibacillus sp. S7]WHY74742.1 protein YhfH [Fictibacillus enclensis]SCB95316.1 YhfH-like protein [Fictibacillus enclensis]
MLTLEFYRNLPEKQCRECGNKMDEQHECYVQECEHCATQQKA